MDITWKPGGTLTEIVAPKEAKQAMLRVPKDWLKGLWDLGNGP